MWHKLSDKQILREIYQIALFPAFDAFSTCWALNQQSNTTEARKRKAGAGARIRDDQVRSQEDRDRKQPRNCYFCLIGYYEEN